MSQNKPSSILQKLDSWLFSLCSKATMRWIKRKKFERHKYDFSILVRKIELFVWVGLIMIPITASILKHEWVGTGILTFLMVFIIVAEIMQIHHIMEIKEEYDWIFSHRKHPVANQIMKEMLESKFEEDYGDRKFYLKINIAWVAFILYANPFMLLLLPFMVFNMYIHYIFDFDEPDGEKKPVKEGVTEMMQRAWQNLIGNLNPSPI